MGALSEIAQAALDLVKRRQRRRLACRNRLPWSADDEQLLRERYADGLTHEIAQELGRSISKVLAKANALGLHKSAEYVAKHCRSLNPATGAAFRFQKGHTTWNKGLKGLQAGGRAKETQFKKGNKPHTWLPIGSFRVSKDGYQQQKVSDTGYAPRDWLGVHILLWVNTFGPVPAGHCVCFRDGNKQNIAIENLELLSRVERMRRNTIHRYPPELKDAIRAVGKLKRTIKEVERHEKQG